MRFCPKCTSIVEDSMTNCPACGAEIVGKQYRIEEYSMNWFNFLIKWWLD